MAMHMRDVTRTRGRHGKPIVMYAKDGGMERIEGTEMEMEMEMETCRMAWLVLPASPGHITLGLRLRLRLRLTVDMGRGRKNGIKRCEIGAETIGEVGKVR
jgi:hypothetical protein